MACMDEHSLPVQAKAVFGGIDKIKIKNSQCQAGAEDDPCERFRLTAKVLSLTYLLAGY